MTDDHTSVAAPARITLTLPPAIAATHWETYDHMNGPDGGIHPAEDCVTCREVFEDGEPVRKGAAGWQHERCWLASLTAGSVDAAWLLIAHEIVRRPSAYRASDIRSVMQNVATIARRGMW